MDPVGHQLVDDLTREFGTSVSRDTVERVVDDSLDSFRDARITSYVRVLARSIARQHLRAITRRTDGPR